MDGDSPQSLSLSNGKDFVNSKQGINPRNSGNHEAVLVPAEDKTSGLERLDIDGKELNPRRMWRTDPGVSMDRSTIGEISSQNKDRNSKLGLNSDREDWADVEDKPTDFSKPIPGLPSLSTSREESIEIGSNTIENALTSEQISLVHKKHGKICWWWRKGRCHHGDKCWFEHNLDVTGAARRSHRGPTIKRKSWKQIHPPNSKCQPGNYRSPRERERDKCSYSWGHREVMELNMETLWKLGRELKMVWPSNIKKGALTKLIMARLRDNGNLNLDSQWRPTKSSRWRVMKNGISQDGKNVDRCPASNSVDPGDDITKANVQFCNIPEEKEKKKRQWRNHSWSSPKHRSNMKKKRCVRKQKITKDQFR